jgi:hypothetical protein
MFFNTEYMQNCVALLPFVLVSYQGRTSSKAKWDSAGKTRIHRLRFRMFIGADTLRTTKEGVRNAYDMLSAVFDDLQSKVPVTSPQQLPGFTAMSGTALTSSGVNVQSPLYAQEGADETLIVNLPGVAVYGADFYLDMVA